MQYLQVAALEVVAQFGVTVFLYPPWSSTDSAGLSELTLLHVISAYRVSKFGVSDPTIHGTKRLNCYRYLISLQGV